MDLDPNHWLPNKTLSMIKQCYMYNDNFFLKQTQLITDENKIV